VAQSVGHLTLDFCSGRDLRVVRLSPAPGSLLSTESAQDDTKYPSWVFSIIKPHFFPDFKKLTYLVMEDKLNSLPL